MGNCLNHELISRYVDGDCSGSERRLAEAHLAQCQNCRQQTASARQKKDSPDKSDLYQRGENTVDIGPATESVTDHGQYATESITQATASRHLSPPWAGAVQSKIEGYDIIEALPRGGQAVVYKAYQKATKRIVVVKVLMQGPHTSDRARYRFEQEVDLAANLKHPNIVTVYDSGIAQGQYYYAMEYIEGKPLDRYVRSKELSIRQIMVLFGKVSSAVAYAHQRGVMHRDLKPGNILVDDEGEPHVLDFGLAKLTDKSAKLGSEQVMTSVAGQIIGTLAFMSPEQASAQPDAIDVRTDVYSIGVILYKILTNKFPYDITGSTVQILRNIQETEPDRPSKIMRQINSEVEAILLKALAKEPQRRYQSAAQLQNDIECWLTGLPIAARSDSSIYIVRKLITKHRYVSMVAGLLLIIILSFSYVSFDLYITGKRAQQQADINQEQLAREVGLSTAFGTQRSLTLFLDAWHGGRLRYAGIIGGYFSRLCKEKAAAEFLLNFRPLAEKEAEFRQKLTNSPWFADFIIGEYHLKAKNSQKALQAFQNSYQAIQQLPDDEEGADTWLTDRLKAHMYELITDKKSSENTSVTGEES